MTMAPVTWSGPMTVDRLLGNAFQIVRHVEENLTDISSLAAISTDISQLADNLHLVTQLGDAALAAATSAGAATAAANAATVSAATALDHANQAAATVATIGAVAQVATRYSVTVGFTDKLTAGEIIQIPTLGGVDFNENFADSVGRVRVSPAVTTTLNILKNGSIVGTVTVNTDSSITFSSVLPGVTSFLDPEWIGIEVPASPDAVLSGLFITLRGIRRG